MQNYRRFRDFGSKVSPSVGHTVQTGFRLYEAMDALAQIPNNFFGEMLTARLINLFQDDLANWTWEAWQSASAADKEDVAKYALNNIGEDLDAHVVYDLFWEWESGLTEESFPDHVNEDVKLQELKRYDPTTAALDKAMRAQGINTLGKETVTDFFDTYCMSKLHEIAEEHEELDLFSSYDGYWTDSEQRKDWQGNATVLCAISKAQSKEDLASLEKQFQAANAEADEIVEAIKKKYSSFISEMSANGGVEDLDDFGAEEYSEYASDPENAKIVRLNFDYEVQFN
jgi:3-methyladenine DNA glycosylase Tag